MAYPTRLPLRYRPLWSHPWWRIARRNKGFRRWLLGHGYLSPHFKVSEAACHDGTPVPRSDPQRGYLRHKAQHHAFNLERLRHRLGGKPLRILSWYRTPSYNAQIGGASESRHMFADATDFDVSFVNSFGPGVFDREADRVFSNGGFGQYPGGSRHTDSRGYRARWSSF